MQPWNAGFTKRTHPSVKKTSDTMRRKKLDNFKAWRDEMKRQGLIVSQYPPLVRNGDLAELLGVILGDGSIHAHDRCDSLRIVGDSHKMGFVERCAMLISSVFGKAPKVTKRNDSNAMNITLYQKNLSKRLGIPTGSRARHAYQVPAWIRKDRALTIRFLRGLYEAEGTLAHHAPTYTHKFIFSNANPHLLDTVANLVRGLGFTVSVSANKAQVSRKEEVQKLANLVEFRNYSS